MSELGQKFKAEREKRGISIQEVGLSLKINPKVIAAIENGDRASLPAKTFLRGFIKSYGQFLKLSQTEVNELFQIEYLGETPKAASPESVAPTTEVAPVAPSEVSISVATDSAPQAPVRPAVPQSMAKDSIPAESKFPIGKTLLGVFLFAVVIFMAKLVDKYQKEKTLPESAASNQFTVQGDDNGAPKAEDLASDIPNAASGASASSGAAESLSHGIAIPVANTQPTPVEKTIDATNLAKVVATPVPISTPPPASATEKVHNPVAGTPGAEATPVKQVKAESALNRPLEVILEAAKAVNVKYDLGDGKWVALDLKPGQIHTLRSKMAIGLEADDGGNLNMIVNGHDRGRSGTSGKPVQLRLRE